jgi:hypothetical protein
MSHAALRGLAFAVGGLLATAAVLLAFAGAGGIAFGLAFWAVLLVVGLLIERWRYKPFDGQRLGPEWVATDERFVDPETGKLVTVYYQPATGERRYVAP